MNIRIIRRLGEANLIPSLRRRPSASFAVVEGLLVQRDVLQVRRHSLETIWIVDLCVNVLQRLHYSVILFLSGFFFTVLDVWFQKVEGPGIFVTINSSLRY